MDISEPTEHWLRDAGYKYYAFVSYPKIHEDIERFAVCVKNEIQKQLAATVHEPQVFVDTRNIPPGTIWEGKVRTELCSSVAMVALCVGAYYRSAHPWCGLEWAAMESLGSRRLRGHLLRPIIPIMLRLEKPIPDSVLATQYVEMTAASLTWERYCTTLAFRRNIQQVVNYIGDVAEALKGNEAIAANCSRFKLPQRSAFIGWQAERQHFPLHVKR